MKDYLRQLLAGQRINLDEGQIDLLEKHYQLVLKWNSATSLTTITSPKDAALLHYFESIFASTFVFSAATSLVDIGSGAGFPGVPMAIALPKIQVTVVDSDRKKVEFLKECRRRLGLKNLHVVRSRFQDLEQSYEVYTCRAIEKFRQRVEQILELASQAEQVMLFLSTDAAKSISSERLAKRIQAVPYCRNRAILLLEKHQDVPRGTEGVAQECST
ncbi:MAG: 16S rRNA (guanine(527)-N(7))-methyltransferase RsmG [Acidobacteriota bacterium]|nr:16S rRNA (guanine(527)-N(7))-methyltransferase RsmG [Blastocatellia bacterium]MDW8412447.1 16S rRNA (guanine(527)-N(7))-methyltransferase RsmG [Acidobacteriota bacterium]